MDNVAAFFCGCPPGRLAARRSSKPATPAAPPRASAGRPQVTVRVTLRDFLAYLSASSAPPGRPAAAVAAAAPPFYLNGWAALAAHPGEVGADCPPPYFSELIDHNDLILEQLDKQLFSSASAGGRRQQQQAGEAPAGAASEASWAAAAASAGGGAWWRRLSLGLSKLFLGPAGIVTRLHYDAGAPAASFPRASRTPVKGGARRKEAQLQQHCRFPPGVTADAPSARRAQGTPTAGSARSGAASSSCSIPPQRPPHSTS